jgi:hypothetical protein
VFLELSPKDSALPDWNGWNKLGRTKLVRTVDVTQKESPPAPKGCTILTPCYTECQPAFATSGNALQKSRRILPLATKVAKALLAACFRRFRRRLRVHVIFRMRNVHQPFVEPSDNVLKTLDAMPRLTRA